MSNDHTPRDPMKRKVMQTFYCSGSDLKLVERISEVTGFPKSVLYRTVTAWLIRRAVAKKPSAYKDLVHLMHPSLHILYADETEEEEKKASAFDGALLTEQDMDGPEDLEPDAEEPGESDHE